MAHRDLRPLIALFAADMFVQAMVDVLLVVMAIELLEIGEGGVGWLSAAWGVGGLAGGVAALALLGRGRLALGLTFGSLLAGLPLVLIGVSPTPASAMILLVLLGVGFALIEVSLLTFTQRLASDDVLARVFGVQESIFLLMTAGGSLVAAALVGAFGAEAALVATGLLLPLLAVVHWRRLGALEAGTKVSERAFGLLRELSIFAPLPVASTETLASRMETLDLPKGTPVTRIGEVGDAFYVVDAGMLEVFAGGEQVASLGPGECFGEVALLRDEPRMATVRAKTAVRLLSLDRTDFLSGIGTHARSSRNAQRLAEERRSSVVFQREAEQEV